MLLVRAKAGPSQIHGLGLIAREFIPAGTAVWRFTPRFDVLIRERDMPRLSETARNQVEHYAYFHTDTRTFVLSSDDDRFTNHSYDPNTRPVGDRAVAVRDIRTGEEITSDYSELGRLNFRRTPRQGMPAGSQGRTRTGRAQAATSVA
jgi:SET domain-containing protein